MYNNMPRALEFAADFLHLPENINRRVDQNLVSDLMEHMLEEAEGRYRPTFPSTTILEAAFFRTPLRIDASLLAAFRDSVVTNPIVYASSEAEIIPDVSLLLLKVACGNVISLKEAGSRGVLARVIEQGIDSVEGTILGTAGSPSSMGDALEKALTEVLRIRLALAIETGSETLTLQRFCGLKLGRGYSSVILKALKSPLLMQIALIDGQEVVKLNACSRHSEGVAFLAELDGIAVSADFPIRILGFSPGGPWAVCVSR